MALATRRREVLDETPGQSGLIDSRSTWIAVVLF